MDLTIRDLNRDRVQVRSYHQQPIRRQIDAEQARKRKKEEERLKDTLVCPIEELNRLRDRLGSINPDRFREILTSYFYDGVMMRTAFCILQAVISTQGQLKDGGLKDYQRIRHWIHATEQIATSASSYVIAASFGASEALLIAKTPQPDEASEGYIHEYVVGLVLNNLRQYVPNFAYVFGTFDCASPIIGHGKVYSWCGYQPGAGYIIYENISPAESLERLNPSISLELFLNYYLQALLALRLANEKYGFTHYDLHGSNLLIRALPEKVAIAYHTPVGKRYLETNAIATIIDYEYSHVRVDGLSLGVVDLENGIFAESFPLHDAFKLLLSSMASMLVDHNETFQQLVPLLRFFTQENPISFVEEEADFLYFLPRTHQTLSRSLDDFIRYLIELYPQLLVETPTAPTLNCVEEQCRSTEAVLSWLEVSAKPKATDMVSLFDLYERFIQEGNRQAAHQLIMSYPYREDVKRNVFRLATALEQLEERVSSFKPIPFHPSDAGIYKESFDDFAGMVNLLLDLQVELEALLKLSIVYSDENTHSGLLVLKSRYQAIRSQLLELSDKYLREATIIERDLSSLPFKLFELAVYLPTEARIISRTLGLSPKRYTP